MNKLYNDTAVQAIANAIRAKNGSSDTYNIAEMSTALNDLSYYAKPTISNVSLATFEADGLPLNSLKVSVEAKQEGSGTPSPENVRPISGWDNVVVSDVGKNLLNNNASNLEVGAIDGNAGWDVQSTTRVRNTVAYPFPLDDLIDNGYTWTIPSGFKMAIRCYDEDDNYITMSGSYIGFVSAIPPELRGKGVKYVRFVFAKTNDATITVDEVVNVGFQIEFGSTPTTYEPYNGTTTTISLPQTVYGGEVDVVNGVLRLVGILETVDPSKFAGTSAGGLGWIDFDDSYVESLQDNNVMCNKLGDVIDGGTGWTSTTPCIAFRADPHVFRLYGNSALFSSGGAYENTSIYFKLKTPITIPLTPTLIKSLNGTNNLSVDCGEVIELEYFKEV